MLCFNFPGIIGITLTVAKKKTNYYYYKVVWDLKQNWGFNIDSPFISMEGGVAELFRAKRFFFGELHGTTDN